MNHSSEKVLSLLENLKKIYLIQRRFIITLETMDQVVELAVRGQASWKIEKINLQQSTLYFRGKKKRTP